MILALTESERAAVSVVAQIRFLKREARGIRVWFHSEKYDE